MASSGLSTETHLRARERITALVVSPGSNAQRENLHDVFFRNQPIVKVITNAAQVHSPDTFVVGRAHWVSRVWQLGNSPESSTEILGEGLARRDDSPPTSRTLQKSAMTHVATT